MKKFLLGCALILALFVQTNVQAQPEGCFWRLTHQSPLDGEIGVSLTPQLMVFNNRAPGDPASLELCNANNAQWQLSTMSGFNDEIIIFDSGFVPAFSSPALTVPEGLLNQETNYYWRMRAEDTTLESISEWTTATSFRTTSQVAEDCNWTVENVFPANSAVQVPLTPNLEVEVIHQDNPACLPEGIQFQIATSPNFLDTEVVYDAISPRISSERDELTSRVPNNLLSLGKLYYWRARYVFSGQFADWSFPTTFATIVRVGAPAPFVDEAAQIAQAIAQLIPNDPATSNANQLIGDREILEAFSLWAQGAQVPGTDGLTINDAIMQDLLLMWLLGTVIEIQ